MFHIEGLIYTDSCRYLTSDVTATSCLRSCLSLPGCGFWSVRTGGPDNGDPDVARATCFLKSVRAGRTLLAESDAISGSIMAEGCGDVAVELKDMRDCQCQAGPGRRDNKRCT